MSDTPPGQGPNDPPLDPTIQQPATRVGNYETVSEVSEPYYSEEVVEERRFTTGALIAAALAGLIIGLLIGYLIGQAGDSDPYIAPATTTTTASTTTTSSTTTSTTAPTTTTRLTTTTVAPTTTRAPTTAVPTTAPVTVTTDVNNQ